MSEQAFRDEMRRMASENGMPFLKEAKLLEVMRPDIHGGQRFINIFRGSTKQDLLLMTSATLYAVRSGPLVMKLEWKLALTDIEGTRSARQVRRGYVVDLLEVQLRSGSRREFWFGFHSPQQYYEIEIAEHNAETAAQQLQHALEFSGGGRGPGGSSSGGMEFDPDGPEKAGASAKAVYDAGDWEQAFLLYVKAIDRLHDFYCFEGFRNRQPGPRDAWLVDGLVAAIGVLKQLQPDVDVKAAVVEATHRLRTISTACDGAGGNSVLYRRGLDGLATAAPDVDVSGVYWT